MKRIDTLLKKGYNSFCAGMAKLADALDLGSSAARRAGSTPVTRTTIKQETT